MENINVENLFVYVPAGAGESFKTAHVGKGTSDKYFEKVAFIADTNEIVTHGQVFAVNKESDLTAIRDAITTLNGDTNVSGSVKYQITEAIGLITNADGGAIDKLEEIVRWFNNLSSTSGQLATELIADVAANKAAIGTQKTDEDDATGLYKYIDDAVSGAVNGSDVLVASLSGTVDNLSGVVDSLSGTVDNLSGVVVNLSGTVDNLSGVVVNLSGTVDDLSGALKAEIERATTTEDELSGNIHALATASIWMTYTGETTGETPTDPDQSADGEEEGWEQ